MSGQCSIRICLNNKCHATFIHAFNRITFLTDIVHMVVIFKTADGASWKAMRRRWMKNGEEGKLYLPKTNEMIYMPQSAGQKRRKVIEPCYLSLRSRWQRMIRKWDITTLLDSNDYTYQCNIGWPWCVYNSVHTIIAYTKAVSKESIWESPEYQWFSVLCIGQSKGWIATSFQIEYIGWQYREKDQWHTHYLILK